MDKPELDGTSEILQLTKALLEYSKKARSGNLMLPSNPRSSIWKRVVMAAI
jgi:hypothetical protein